MLGIPKKLISLTRITSVDSTSEIVRNGLRSEDFTARKELELGDPMTTKLFNLLLEQLQ